MPVHRLGHRLDSDRFGQYSECKCRGVFGIFTVSFNGGESVRLADPELPSAAPASSPDGTRIAFLSVRDGNPDIYAMNSDGSAQVNLANSPAQESVEGDYAWSPDGTRILFNSDRDGDVDVFVVDADGSNQTNLTKNPATDFASVWVP